MNGEHEYARKRVTATIHQIEQYRPQAQHFIFTRSGGFLRLSCWCGKASSVAYNGLSIDRFVAVVNRFLETHCTCEQKEQGQ